VTKRKGTGNGEGQENPGQPLQNLALILTVMLPKRNQHQSVVRRNLVNDPRVKVLPPPRLKKQGARDLHLVPRKDKAESLRTVGVETATHEEAPEEISHHQIRTHEEVGQKKTLAGAKGNRSLGKGYLWFLFWEYRPVF